jgi:hypothetical protein
MNTVFVLGAGASYGEEIEKRYPEARPHRTPLTNGFFDLELLREIGYSEAENRLQEVLEYARERNLICEDFGHGRWKSLDLEQLFTSIEVEREFQNPESDEGARLTIIRNQLVRHIRRVIGQCTKGARGKYYSILRKLLKDDDSVITFNWDLLMDQAFTTMDMSANHYSNFIHRLEIETHSFRPGEFSSGDGLYLKLHGSLNWFRCGNRHCPSGGKVFASNPVVDAEMNAAEEEVMCWQCESVMTTVIIPPLLRKPIAEDAVIRAAWGMAREKLLNAAQVIVIGFSAPPTDFYAHWLLRSTVGRRPDAWVEVVNPSNDVGHRDHALLKERMESIFLRGYGKSFRYFSEVEAAVEFARGTR